MFDAHVAPPTFFSLARLATLLLGTLSVGLAACTPAPASSAAGTPPSATHLALVAYSTTQEAYAQLIAAFQQTPAGKGVAIDPSFGASGTQTQAVINGLDADVVALSLESDLNKLVAAGLVAGDWNADQYRGLVTDSIAVLVVRKGNPTHIQTWDDLLQSGVDVVTPDVFQSGGAKWNLLAAYGAKLKSGGSPDAARAYLKDLLGHVSVQPASGREAMATFVGGKGDVLISYENEALTAQQAGQQVDYVVPTSTILIENPIAVLKGSRNPAAAQAFVEYLRGPEGQRLWARLGYRPVVKEIAAEVGSSYPAPSGLFTIADLGGWPSVDRQFFDRDNGMVSQILQELGRSGGHS
jgi:sulfate transport system substrate-binding protein